MEHQGTNTPEAKKLKDDMAFDALRKFQTRTMTLQEMETLVEGGAFGFTNRYRISYLGEPPHFSVEVWDNDGYHGPYDWSALHEIAVEKTMQLGKFFETFKPTAIDFVKPGEVKVIGDAPGWGTVRIPLLSLMHFEELDKPSRVQS
ncbi:MAG TPA: hypothetical protein VF996_02395 [Candidatus Saccharimonadales bacterium]